MPIPTYTTGDVLLARVARRMGMQVPQLLADAPWWRDVCVDAAASANQFCHQKVLAVLGSSANVVADSGMTTWANQVGYCHALREAMAFTDNVNPAAVDQICKCEEQGDHWVPTVEPTGDLGVSHIVTSGPMDTTGDYFKIDSPS